MQDVWQYVSILLVDGDAPKTWHLPMSPRLYVTSSFLFPSLKEFQYVKAFEKQSIILMVVPVERKSFRLCASFPLHNKISLTNFAISRADAKHSLI